MYISPWPGLTPHDLFRSGVPQESPYPLNAPHRLGFCVARNGIYHLFRALDFKSSDVVLVPDYHSGNEVSAMLAAGATIAYYPIRRNLEPDLDALSRLTRRLKPRVIYLIHYLGWAQPMREMEVIAREHGSMVIEDCALSLLSESDGKPLGSSGDYSIFCLYKTLPVPNGGLLVQNRNPLPELANLVVERCPRMSVLGRTAELALEALRSRGDRAGKVLFAMKQRIGRTLRRNGLRHIPVGDIGWNPSNVNIGMSPFTDHLVHRVDYKRIARTRRQNFLHLRELLPTLSLLREDLPEGTCPLFFPILVQNKTSAARALRDRGISAVEFWNDQHPHAAPHSGPEARFLHSHVLEIPIHQDVTPAQVEYIAEQVENLKLQFVRQLEPVRC